MKVGSLYSGCGSYELAAMICGMEPVWCAETDRFSSEVLKVRVPKAKNLGDVMKIDGAEIEPVDILVGSGSIIDKKVKNNGALADSNEASCFSQMIRIAKEMLDATNGRFPRYILWENAVTDRKKGEGKAFREILGAFISLRQSDVYVPPAPGRKWKQAGAVVGTGWSFAWRALTATFYGLPQKRTRDYYLLCTGNERARQILFDCASSKKHQEKSYKEWRSLCRETGDGDNKADLRRGRGKNVDFFRKLYVDKYCRSEVASPLTEHLAKEFSDVVIDEDLRMRRLTPRECFRLQGFPDWWTDKLDGGDMVRYRAAANASPVPCLVDILTKIRLDGEKSIPQWIKPEQDGGIDCDEEFAECGMCHAIVYSGWKMKFCPECGERMKAVEVDAQETV